MRSLLCLSVCVAFGLCETRAVSGTEDSVAKQLGLTAETGSLPIWTKPSQQARQDLGEYVRQSHQGVMLVGHPRGGTGTAWVVSKEHRLLATNAHVADLMHSTKGEMYTILNATSTLFKVERVWYHPGVRRRLGGGKISRQAERPEEGPIDPLCPDVALLQLSGEGPELPVELRMAGPEAFQTLFAQPAAILGYPGHDTQWPALGESAEATFHEGVISRLTNFQNNVSCPLAEKQFLQYTMSTWGGFSGSPILLTTGEVVALHNSAVKAESGSQEKWIPHGVRIDCLWELLAHHKLTDKVPIPVDASQLNVERWYQDDPRDIALRKAIKLVAEGSHLIYVEQKFDEGAKRCSQAIALSPDYAKAYEIRGGAYINYWFKYRASIPYETGQKQLELGLADWKKCSQLDPTNALAIIGICRSYNNIGQHSREQSFHRRSLEVMNKLLSTESLTEYERADAHSTRAAAFNNLGQDEDALQDHNEAIRLYPTEPIFWDNRGDFWRVTGNSARAQADFSKARELREKAKLPTP